MVERERPILKDQIEYMLKMPQNFGSKEETRVKEEKQKMLKNEIVEN